jgi:hypothetical protein
MLLWIFLDNLTHTALYSMSNALHEEFNLLSDTRRTHGMANIPMFVQGQVKLELAQISVLLLLNFRDTIFHKVKDQACYKSGVMSLEYPALPPLDFEH